MSLETDKITILFQLNTPSARASSSRFSQQSQDTATNLAQSFKKWTKVSFDSRINSLIRARKNELKDKDQPKWRVSGFTDLGRNEEVAVQSSLKQ